MKNLLGRIKSFFINIYKNEYVRAFAFIFLIGLFFFLTRAAFNGFTLPFTGDYTSQTYNYYAQGYHIVKDFFKTGQYPLFDFSNFLGANYLGTQSFYYVFSPLFYLLCIWPEKLLYQGILFHMVFKYALAGTFMYILLRRYFHVGKRYAWLGGFVYAFSGWALFYLWFHFSDIMAFFPLYIMGFERLLKERKGGLLSISIFLCGITNYFFLVNFIIFGVVYALYRWIYIYGINKKKGYNAKVRWGVLLQGILYSAIGVMMACICLLPSFAVALASNRSMTSASYTYSLLCCLFNDVKKVDGSYELGSIKTLVEIFKWSNLKELLKVLFVWEDRAISSSQTVKGGANVGYILSNWVILNTNCWDNVIFDNATLDNSLGGLFISTPLNMLLLPSVIHTFKSKNKWAIFGVIAGLIIPFIPFTANVAFAFTSLYGRWQLWVVLVGIIYIIPTLEHFEGVNRKIITFSLLINYLFVIVAFIISKANGTIATGYEIEVAGLEFSAILLVALGEAIIMLFVWVFYTHQRFKVETVKRIMSVIIVIEVGASIIGTIEGKTYYDWESYYLSQPSYDELVSVVSDIKEDQSFYRVMNVEADRQRVNLPAALNYAGCSTFNSTYDFELDTFKNRHQLAYGGTWVMGNHEKRYYLDQYISTKYYIVDKNDMNNDNKYQDCDKSEYANGLTLSYYNGTILVSEGSTQQYRYNMPWGYVKTDSSNSYNYYDVYENTNYFGIGYGVDNYLLAKSASGEKPYYYEEMYTTTAIINNDDEDYVKENTTSTKIDSYSSVYKNAYFNDKWNMYFSPREDYSNIYDENNNLLRQIEKIETSKIAKSEVARILPGGSQFLHGRWYEKERLGDQFIFELKDGAEPVAKDATSDNIAYITIGYKMGPCVLISLYNGDKLITQDAHMTTDSSISSYSYEWKTQRGFYVDQPVDKIIVEYINDTSFDKAFDSMGNLYEMNITYTYQEDMEKLVNKTLENSLKDLTYKNSTFTFTTNYEANKLVVTSIPYDSGWKLKANNEDVKIIKVNDGFVGFIAKSGNVTYKLSYKTPYLALGLFASIIGVLLLIGLSLLYKNTKIDILEKENKEYEPILALEYENERKYNQNVKESFKKIFRRKKKDEL